MKLTVIWTLAIVFTLFNLFEKINGEKYRVCVVDGRGGFKRAAKYCPILDSPDSKVECVVGVDRLDCLRRISKGKVDFSVFSPEDLVTATNSEVEVLLTNEMRFTKEKYEYQVVAIVHDEAGIKSKHDLRGKNFCHPGYGYETDWTNILANYLEASAVPQTCNPSMTLTENRIFSSSKYFKAACKAGPWVNDPILDTQLKRKYPNLCELCDSPNKCNMNDKYWGRRGPLFCLTDGYGDISWSRLDDVKIHFGLSPGSTIVSPEGYSYLCPDGTTISLNSTNKACVWVVKPWPVIASKRKRAAEIQSFIYTLNQYEQTIPWKIALLKLIQTFKQEILPIQPTEPIETYLTDAPGFLSANSFTGCHPPRTIRVCTTSNIANAKCGWLREAAAVYGIEPDMDCLKADNITHCMDAIKYNAADLVLTPPDKVSEGKRVYNLETLFYETVPDSEQYIVVPVVKTDSEFKTIEDLKGAKACFPIYDGIAWNAVVYTLYSKHLINACPFEEGMAEYFGSSCTPNLPKNMPLTLNNLCQDNLFDGEYGAIHCLVNADADVAFMSKHDLDKFFRVDPRESVGKLRREQFRILGEDFSTPNKSHLSWAPIGQAMISANKSDMWRKDTLDVFQQLDNLFGKNFKSVTTPFTLFGLFDGKTNVLFHDATIRLKNVPFVKYNAPNQYDEILNKIDRCITSSSTQINYVVYYIVVFVLINILM